MGWTIAANAAQPNVELSPAPLIAGIVSRLKERVPSKRLRYIALQELVRLRRELRAAVERRLLAAENAVAAALNESLQLGEASISKHALPSSNAKKAVCKASCSSSRR
jgi:hypothetical protein